MLGKGFAALTKIVGATGRSPLHVLVCAPTRSGLLWAAARVLHSAQHRKRREKQQQIDRRLTAGYRRHRVAPSAALALRFGLYLRGRNGRVAGGRRRSRGRGRRYWRGRVGSGARSRGRRGRSVAAGVSVGAGVAEGGKGVPVGAGVSVGVAVGGTGVIVGVAVSRAVVSDDPDASAPGVAVGAGVSVGTAARAVAVITICATSVGLKILGFCVAVGMRRKPPPPLFFFFGLGVGV